MEDWIMKKFIRDYRILLIVSIVILGIAIFYLVYNCRAVNHYLMLFEEKYGSTEENDREEIDLYQVPGYHELLQERGCLDGLIRLAKSDSVNLFLNLTERSAQLMIKGVAVRTVPIGKIKTDVLFDKASDEALYNWLSEPLQIIGSVATIDKEPVNVVLAPKDSSDEIPACVPDTLQKEPVFFILETDRDLRLYFYQSEPLEWVASLRFGWQYKWREAKEAIHSVFSFRLPDYTPVLYIGLTKEDAKVIYRAIPEQGQIVITL